MRTFLIFLLACMGVSISSVCGQALGTPLIYSPWLGPQQPNIQPVFGTLGSSSADNTPGGRIGYLTTTDAQGRIWLYGGYVINERGSKMNEEELAFNYQANLWCFHPDTKCWERVNGGTNSDSIYQFYESLGEDNPANSPGDYGGYFYNACFFTDNEGHLYLFPTESPEKSLWRYTIANHQWACLLNEAKIDNDSLVQPEAKDPENPLNIQWGSACAIDSKGDFWFFGGFGIASTDRKATIAVLWRFSNRDHSWHRIGMSSSSPGTHGQKGEESTNFWPPPREFCKLWADTSGHLWMFGGQQRVPPPRKAEYRIVDGTKRLFRSCFGSESIRIGLYSDLWRYDIASSQWAWMGGKTRPDFEPIELSQQKPSEFSPQNWPDDFRGARLTTTAAGDVYFLQPSLLAPSQAGRFCNLLWQYSAKLGEWEWHTIASNAAEQVQPQTNNEADLRNSLSLRFAMALGLLPDGTLYAFGGNAYLPEGNLNRYAFFADLYTFKAADVQLPAGLQTQMIANTAFQYMATKTGPVLLTDMAGRLLLRYEAIKNQVLPLDANLPSGAYFIFEGGVGHRIIKTE